MIKRTGIRKWDYPEYSGEIRMEKPGFNKRFLAALAYIFAVPSLFIVLTPRDKENYLGRHGRQALFLWLSIIIFWVLLRLVFTQINNLYYSVYFVYLSQLCNFAMWLYAAWCGLKAFRGETIEIPHISRLAG